jgi:hypothetical protein
LEDLINSIFECSGSIFVLLSIRRLRREKKVRGVDYKHIAFFTAWGFWNLYYYPSLEQWMSFFGGLLITIANLVWVIQLIYYVCKEKRGNRG